MSIQTTWIILKLLKNLQKSFYDFALKVPFYGKIIACGDDPIIRQIFENFPKRIVLYGFDEKNDLVLSGEQGNYSLYRSDRLLGTRHLVGQFHLNVPGRHNALNAVAAICAGMGAGIPFATCAKGLERFEGVDRRFHFKGEKAWNQSLRRLWTSSHGSARGSASLPRKYPDQRLVVFFQPHRYSRTQHCWHDFTTAFMEADEVLLTDIYPAGEAPIPGISSEKLAQEMKHEHAHIFCVMINRRRKILGMLKEGDVFVTLGAGDGWKLGLDVLNQL